MTTSEREHLAGRPRWSAPLHHPAGPTQAQLTLTPRSPCGRGLCLPPQTHCDPPLWERQLAIGKEGWRKGWSREGKAGRLD